MKSELRKKQYTVTHFLTAIINLAHVIVSWQIQKYISYCAMIVSQNFAFEGNFQVQAPEELYSDRRFNGGFFCAPSLGSYIKNKPLQILEGLIFGILQYIQWILL